MKQRNETLVALVYSRESASIALTVRAAAVRQINAVSGDDAWASTHVSSDGPVDIEGSSKTGVCLARV
ncbi:hypothetical protein KM043_008172 [Ampulex compressa]|nr:hypothetical protein KM043_008172 [Ampulex compressa]